jgi:hypothetical protein
VQHHVDEVAAGDAELRQPARDCVDARVELPLAQLRARLQARQQRPVGVVGRAVAQQRAEVGSPCRHWRGGS